MKSKKQLKQELHKLIDSIEDEHVLNVLNDDIVPYVIQNRAKEAEEEDDLTEDQLKELKEAIKEADRGETVSYGEFKKAMSRWLTK
jgi:methyl coenzyme M reductase gamma subunit